MSNRTPRFVDAAHKSARRRSCKVASRNGAPKRCLAGVIAFAIALLLVTAQESIGNPPAGPTITPVNTVALRLAITDLSDTFGEQYPHGGDFLKRLDELEKKLAAIGDVKAGGADSDASEMAQTTSALAALQCEALLANPLLDFERLLLVKRSERSPGLGLTANWQGNCSLPRTGFDDEIAMLSPVRDGGKLSTIYKPDGAKFVGDVDLHFDGRRMLFSSIGTHGRWQVFEVNVDGSGLRQVTRGEENDVDNYDPCYLPSGNIIYSSTAVFQGVPCVQGSDHVANLFVMDAAGANVRQLTFDQDHDWCPTVTADGRVMYLRWEYSDIPHFASRILFTMNPDGTDQKAYYGSNSYWPNSMFFARPVPGSATMFTTVISGHHDVPRMGELLLFDTARGDHEADGVVQRIGDRGKVVEPVLLDGLVRNSWPKFLHPWPLSEKYFLVSAKPTPASKWGIYLADVFDNLLLIKELDGYALLEPVPLRATTTPPVIADRVQPDAKEAMVYIADIYSGPGLAGVPRGAVKKLRLFTYHFAYHGMGGQVNRVGLDGPWDVKRIIGTVPVQADGSALFSVPANTPISLQPLDEEGKALQLMRSWLTAMPGEKVSCVGCHDRPQAAAPPANTLALAQAPAAIEPWYGPTRGFSFTREVQPVLDKYCIGCHNGQSQADAQVLVDLRLQEAVHPQAAGESYNRGTKFTPSYLALRRFVRTPTIESDMHLLTPGDFHADTTQLVQMLRKGHHGVQLDAEAWDRIITWIDLHAPAHGTWHEIVGEGLVADQRDRRREMMRRYAGRDEDPEAIYTSAAEDGAQNVAPIIPESPPLVPVEKVECPNWPLDAAQAAQRQQAADPWQQTIDLGEGVKLALVRIPAGEFVMGDANGSLDELPLRRVRIEKPFWMGQFEVTNEQYRRFDKAHDSRLEHGDFLQFSDRDRGYALNTPQQPVVRVSQQRAEEFCRWLSEKTGRTFTLPSEAQWEYACRGGTATPLSYGEVEDDFSQFANLADRTLNGVERLEPWSLPEGAIPPWRPADVRYNDGARVAATVGSYQPNAWGLYDMHGNAAEWTRSRYEKNDETGRCVVRGGSWSARPGQSRSSYRLAYWPHQRVYDVGFRVICE